MARATAGGRSLERRPNGRWQLRWREDAKRRSRTFDRKKDAVAFEKDLRREQQPPADDVAPGVRAAVERDLKMFAELDPDLASGSLAAGALELGRQLDDPENSATSKSMCQRELRETLGRLRDMLPDDQENDQIDDLRDRRNARRARSAGA